MKPTAAPSKLYRQIVETHEHMPSLNCLATWARLPYSTAWRAPFTGPIVYSSAVGGQ